MKLLNVGCGTHYAQGWVNADTWETDDTKPDVKVTPGKPYPFEDSTFDAIYMGHVLEHIPWLEVSTFLKDMQRIAKPNAPMLIVGPDVHKTIKRWKDGQEPWWLVESVMEHLDVPDTHVAGLEWWDGAHHHWNCHETRVEKLLNLLEFNNVVNKFDAIPNDPAGKSWFDEENQIEWPVVGKYYWQLAFSCKNKL
jgi:SAM-dependent methyltransferase